MGFYLANDYRYIVFLLFTILLTYLGAKHIESISISQREYFHQNTLSKEEKKAYKTLIKRKKLQIVFIISTICFCILFLFKSTKFIDGWSLILPLGMSFYTFQSIGYLIDVYRGTVSAETNLLHYALFISYFPQIIEGPINRFGNLQKQLLTEHRLNINQIRAGMWLFLWGLAKKLVIADRVSAFVSSALSGDVLPPGSICILGVFLFNLQLYADFSGGIDMVRGISEMFDIHMDDNFRQPFFARTIGDYWRRWHISLSSWIRDYVFYPMAFSKTYGKISKWIGKHTNEHFGVTITSGGVSIITFLLIGIWHDLSWAYVAYGLWHGIIMALGPICKPYTDKIALWLGYHQECLSVKLLQRLRTWILISIGEVFTIMGNMRGVKNVFLSFFMNFNFSTLLKAFPVLGISTRDFLIILFFVAFWVWIESKREAGVHIREALALQPLLIRYLATIVMIFVIVAFGEYYSSVGTFIYGGF